MNLYYDRGGNPIRLMRWATLMEDHRYREVAFAQGEEACVSTVWIGIDHRIFGDGPPLIYETMVFGGKHNGYCERYPTVGAARQGHARICQMVFDPQPELTQQTEGEHQ
ncbi:MAG TPA: hypothetical protein VFX15_00140 [Actinomycetes bacterium]|nr:hypothetical protein [Actinomycetes bacterium]